MSLKLEDLRDFEARVREEIPGFEVKFKDESSFMRALGFLVYPFNPRFADGFTTTIGKTVYFPSRTSYEKNPGKSFRTLSHEFVHLWDTSAWFTVSYMFPQILAVLPLLAFAVIAWPHSWLLLLPFVGYGLGAVIAPKTMIGFWVSLGVALISMIGLSVFLTGWGTLAFVAAIACLAPWHAPWRTHWELRGYTMSVAVDVWLKGQVLTETQEHIVQNFVGPNYFFMCWSREHVTTTLEKAIQETRGGALQGRSPYRFVHSFLQSRGLLFS